MKYRIVTTKRFDKAVLRCISRGLATREIMYGNVI